MSVRAVKPTSSVKVDAATYKRLRRLAKEEERSIMIVIRRAVEAYDQPRPMKLEPGTPDPRD